MESSIFENMLPTQDVSVLLMSSGANQRDVITFDKLMESKGIEGMQIVTEPQGLSDHPLSPRPISFEALDQLAKIQSATQSHFAEALNILGKQSDFNPLDKQKLHKMDHLEATTQLNQEMQKQSTNLLKAQMHMNLFSITISIVNRVANSVNDGLKTLYRQQG